MTLNFPRAHAQCKNVVAACCGTLSVVCSTCGHRPSNTHPDNFSMWNMWLLWRSFSNICPQMHIRLRLSYSVKDQTQYLQNNFFSFIEMQIHGIYDVRYLPNPNSFFIMSLFMDSVHMISSSSFATIHCKMVTWRCRVATSISVIIPPEFSHSSVPLSCRTQRSI